MLADQRRRLQSQHASLLAQPAPPTDGVLQAAYLAPASPSSVAHDLAKIERDLTLLDEHEQALRAEAFHDQSQHVPAGTPVMAEADASPDAVDRVRITVAGEGQLHLRGPLEGINAIARMVHEIDQPVGQVKIGIHVVQFTGAEDAAFEGVHEVVDRYLGHARQMSQASQLLFRTALGNVAARYYSSNPERFEEAFFYGPCVRNFRSLNGAHGPLSISLLDSRDIVTTLYLAGLATQEARRDILTEFQRLVAAELPRRHEQYQQAIAAARRPHAEAPSFLTRLTGTSARVDATSPPDLRPPDLHFTQTMSYLDSFGDQPNSANALQVATARFQRALLELRQVEAAVAAMRNDRLLLAFASSNRSPTACVQTVSGELLDSASFGRLADHVIEEQAARVLDLREVVRSELAALDGQLRRLTTAFEEDLRRQFYKPALEDLRRHSSAGKVRMGQIQTTTIRTHDRMLARVSPSQVAVVDQPIRPVLLQEGLQVANGLAREAQSLALSEGRQTASKMVASAGSPRLAEAGLASVPGQHLGELAGPSERITVSVGDDIAVTPVIQADGFSVAFHLVYTHIPQRDTEGKKPIPSGVQRHLIETDVHLPSLELQEVSRFRVALDSDVQEKGIPLLEDVPGAGALFRPRRAAASTTQENIILVDAVVYPTALALAGKCWLALDPSESRNTAGPAAGIPAGQGELTGWVLQTLRRQAQASLSEAGNAPLIAPPSSEPLTTSAGQPFRRASADAADHENRYRQSDPGHGTGTGPLCRRPDSAMADGTTGRIGSRAVAGVQAQR
jgi:hypothetical protein